MKNFTPLLLSITLFPVVSMAQQKLSGRIKRTGASDVLAGVTVTNHSREAYNMSDEGGNYRIEARSGDTVIFSSAAYLPDTLIVSPDMLQHGYDVSLDANVAALPSVTVSDYDNYQKDSMQRHDDYAWLLDKKHPIKLVNDKAPGDAPGFSFSPIDYYSKGQKDQRRLKKRLIQDEKNFYIDSRFPEAKIALLTRLKGDSLELFMTLYRPSYDFCRKSNDMDMLFYINEKLVLFRKRQPMEVARRKNA